MYIKIALHTNSIDPPVCVQTQNSNAIGHKYRLGLSSTDIEFLGVSEKEKLANMRSLKKQQLDRCPEVSPSPSPSSLSNIKNEEELDYVKAIFVGG
ncbi:19464_t:CDS:2 [Entrophospora sp. SA101]|nr:19464_t:CDS:2 [Entrophospora sp. SA101]